MLEQLFRHAAAHNLAFAEDRLQVHGSPNQAGPDTWRFPNTRLWGIAGGRGRPLYRKRFGFGAHNKLPQAKTQQAGETQRQPVTAWKFQDPGKGQPGA